MNNFSWMRDKSLSGYVKLLESWAGGPTSNNRTDSIFWSLQRRNVSISRFYKISIIFISILNFSSDKYCWQKWQCNGDKGAKNESRGWPSWWGNEGNIAGRVGSCWSQYKEQGFKNRKPKWRMSSPNVWPQLEARKSFVNINPFKRPVSKKNWSLRLQL